MATTKSKNGGAAVVEVNRVPEVAVVARPNIRFTPITIRGDAPYVQHKFTAKSQAQMRRDQEDGGRAKGKNKKEPRDFAAECEASTHRSTDGWHGIPAAGIRAAMISACRVAGLVMTRAKLSVFIVPDGFDEQGTPLVRITKGKPKPHDDMVRVDSGQPMPVTRPMWAPGWEAVVTVRYDGDQFDAQSVCNLLHRAGLQVGLGEGRPDSKRSSGMGWGTFEVVRDEP